MSKDLEQQPVVPGRAGAGVRRAAGAERLHRAGADALAAAGEGGRRERRRHPRRRARRRRPGPGGLTGTGSATGAGAARRRLRPPRRRRSSSLPFSGSTYNDTVTRTRRRSTRRSSPRRTGSSPSGTWPGRRSRAGGGGRATARSDEPLRRRRCRGQAHVRAARRTAGAGTRGRCSPSWSAPRPPRAGGARCWRRARASPRPIALYTSAGLRPHGAVRGVPALAEQPVLREDPAAVRVKLRDQQWRTACNGRRMR